MQTSGFNAELGRQQFLDLLVTQLQYQDPLEPVGQQEFIQQLAQFSVVEGVENLNAQFSDFVKVQSLSGGTDFIGKIAEYESPLTGETLQGRVEEARVIDGKLSFKINNDQVLLENIGALIADAA